MQRTAGDLRKLVVAATDGEIGSVEGLFFDDERWTIRHIVVDTGKWLPGRRVLISPPSVDRIDDQNGRIVVKLSREKVRNSPDVDTDKPVSRQQEMALYAHYGYGPYWDAGELWGASYYPGSLHAVPPPPAAAFAPVPLPDPEHADAAPAETPQPSGDVHLRSTGEVAGYHLKTTDGEVGHIDDFALDDESWAIRYLVIDTSNWPGGQRVLVPVDWVRSVEWDQKTVTVGVTSDEVRARADSPASRGTSPWRS